ncbi:MAG: NAD(P)/FAD-dependent oxidoreductase [Synergistaceae bacterium]
MSNIYDVIIIGGGIVGNAIARELSRYTLKTALLEKEPDVGFETSCRNSGVLHSGINYKPNTLRAKLAVKGNAMMDQLCDELKVKIKRIGKLTVALDEEEMPGINRLMEQGKANGVAGLEVLNSRQMQEKQPNVEGIAAIWSPTTAIISPYGLTIALAENACENDVEYFLKSKVISIKKDAGIFIIKTSNGKEFKTKMVINSAGLYSDKISEMIGVYTSNDGQQIKIYPCRGEYYVLDKRLDGLLKTLIYPVPGAKAAGLGIHLTPTVDGNILIGPSAQYIDEEAPEDYKVTAPILEDLKKEGQKLLYDLKMSDFIRSFAGNRAKRTPPSVGGNADFIIEESDTVKGFINIVGIESPGVTSAPAIAEMVKDIIGKTLILGKKSNFKAERPGLVGHFCDLTHEEQEKLIKENPEYGEIICRCEKITKKEIRDAIENKLGAKTLASIKYRARNGMGRCQGGFCTPRIVRMLRDEYGYKPEDYILREENSPLFTGNVREDN